MQCSWETRLHIRGLSPGFLAGFNWEEAWYLGRTPGSWDGFGLGGDRGWSRLVRREAAAGRADLEAISTWDSLSPSGV